MGPGAWWRGTRDFDLMEEESRRGEAMRRCVIECMGVGVASK